MICPGCGKEIPDYSRFCTYCGTDLSGMQHTDSTGGNTGANLNGNYIPYQNGTYQNNTYQNNTFQNGGYQNNPYQDQQAPKNNKGLIAAIVAIVMVLVAAVIAGAFVLLRRNSEEPEDSEGKTASSAIESASDDESDASDSASTEVSEEEEPVTGEEALDLACRNLENAKGLQAEFEYEFNIGVSASDEGVEGEITEKGTFNIDTDLESSSDIKDLTIAEHSEGTIDREMFGDKSFDRVTLDRADIGGELVTYISKDNVTAIGIERMTSDQIIAFSDYSVYDAELQKETEEIEGTECFVYVASGTYDQGGISGVVVPVTDFYTDEGDECDVTIYVSKKDAQIVRVDTKFNKINYTPDTLRKSLGIDDLEMDIKSLTYSLTYKDIDKDPELDTDYSALEKEADGQECDSTSYIEWTTAISTQFADLIDDADTDDEDDTDDQDSGKNASKGSSTKAAEGYRQETHGILTYDIPEDWKNKTETINGDSDMGSMTADEYYPKGKNPDTLFMVADYEMDTSYLDEEANMVVLDAMIQAVAASYGLDRDNVENIKVNGNTGEKISGTISESGSEYDVEIVCFEMGDQGYGVVLIITEDMKNCKYLDEYNHLLESIEF